MKKSLFAAVVLGSFLFVVSGSALATLVEYTDLYDPKDFWFDGTTNHDSLNFTHDIASYGYSFPPDLLEEATLTVFLRDDDDNQNEGFKVQFNLGEFSSAINLGGDTQKSFNVLTQVKPNGLLRVVINHQSGDFWFESSELYARWDERGSEEAASPTPEPASMLLLGTGLVGVAGLVRNRKKKQA